MDAGGRTRFVSGSDTVCTSLLSSLRIVFVATPVVALLKCLRIKNAVSERRVREHTPRTMLDTPLVRGERGVFIPLAGGVRLDMALGRREEG